MKTLLPLIQQQYHQSSSKRSWQRSLSCVCLLLLSVSYVGIAGPGKQSSVNNARYLNSTTVFSGTYTVGPGGNYTTLTAAISDYNTLLLSGPVVFNLIGSSYSAGETFPIVINSNTLASATNTLTIKPATGITATISGTINSDAMFKVLGSFVTIDGSNNGTKTRNLTFINNGVTSARTVMFGSTGTNPVVNSSIKNCNVLGGSNTSNAVILCDGAAVNSPGYFNNITVENNVINKAFYGVYCNAVVAAGNGSGLLVTGNDLTSLGTNAIQFAGVFVQGIDGATVSYNKIGNFISTDPTTDCGIWISNNTKNAVVLGNTITNLNYTGGAGFGSRGIYVSTNLTNANILLSGNMISNINGDGNDYMNSGVTLYNPAGILMVGPQTGIRIYHNTIVLGAVAGFTNTLDKANALSACVRIYGSGTADVRNNIMVNNLGINTTGYGSVVLMASNTSAQFTSLNYNDYVVTPAGTGIKAFGMIGTTPQTTLPNWKVATGKDVASLNVVPVFTSVTDLHLVPGSNPLLSDAALPIAGYNQNDVDDATRNPLTPDIGCDEFIEPNKAFWVGKTSIDWATASNWEANVVPDGASDVLVNGGYTFLPTLATTQAVYNLTLSVSSPAPALTINNGTLQVNGTLSFTDAGIEASNGAVQMNGTSAQTIPTGIFVNNSLRELVIGNTNSATGVTLGSQLDIYRSVTFSASGLKLTTNDFLTFKSTAAETAWLGNVTGKTITGNVTVERYVPTVSAGAGTHGKSWQLLSVPVSGNQTIKAAWQEGAATVNANPVSGYGTLITGDVAGALAAGFDVYTASGASIKLYNPATNGYTSVPNTNSFPIANQKGYMVFVRGDRSVTAYNQAAVPTVLRAKGKLFTTGVDSPPASNVQAAKFESVGNPYASAIDFTQVTRTGGVDNTYYVWDPLLAGIGYGAYQTISATTGWLPSPGGTANYPSGTPVTSIQSGQAFFVHATGAAGTVSFTENTKIAGSKTTFRTNNADRQLLVAGLYSGADTTALVADGNIVVFDADYSNLYTGDDALKFGSSSVNFGIMGDGRLLAVEARSLPANNDTIFYTMNNLRKQAYQLRFTPQNIQAGNVVAYFEDRFLQTSVLLDLNVNSSIDFIVTDNVLSAASNRFYIVFKEVNIVPVSFTGVSANRNSDNTITVNWKVENETSMESYDLEHSTDGRSFSVLSNVAAKANNGGAASYDDIDNKPAAADNFYRIRARGLSGQVQYSSIVKVSPVKETAQIIVYPNPVINKTLAVSFKGQPTGNYKIELFNTTGQLIYNSRFVLNNANEAKQFSLGQQIPAGVYQMSITGEEGTKNNQQVIIQ